MAVDPPRAMPHAPCPRAPCPPPGERRGLEDQRGQLFNELVRLLQVCQPKMFLFENVPGLARSRDEARAPMQLVPCPALPPLYLPYISSTCPLYLP